MFDTIVANLCSVVALNGSCSATIQAFSIQSHLKQNVDESELQFVQEYTKKTYKLLGKEAVEYSVAVGFLADSLIEKRVQIRTPLNPIVHTFQFNANKDGYNWGLGWKWNWE